MQQTLRPSVPNDVALSFYVHASKLILSVYHLGINASTHQTDIISRNQVCVLSDNNSEFKEYKNMFLILGISKHMENVITYKDI